MRDKHSHSWCSFDADATPVVLRLRGSWRLPEAEGIWRELSALKLTGPLVIHGAELESLDSACALMLLRTLQHAGIATEGLQLENVAEDHARVLEGVRKRLLDLPENTKARTALWPLAMLAGLGRATTNFAKLVPGYLNFLGATLSAFAQLLWRPKNLRIKELTVQLQNTCLSAIPVVSLVTMLIGVTMTYLLGLQAEKYGANIFVVDGVGIGITREFSPIIVATIVAGRSGAAFTAQLGAMRLTEEIDALRTLGLSPMNVLVLPRVLALVMALPLLVFVGDVMGVVGMMLVADPLLGLTPSTVLNRLQTSLDISHFWVGFVKAPVFALFIAAIGCRMGMTVERDSRAVGLATTSTVVQGIVSVILLDAAFAIVLQAMGI